MLDIYKRSPVHGDGSYPSKNTQADAIHSSIVTNRYLVEAAEMPWSLSLHLVDIASVHLMILKDAAKSYRTRRSKTTTAGSPLSLASLSRLGGFSNRRLISKLLSSLLTVRETHWNEEVVRSLSNQK